MAESTLTPTYWDALNEISDFLGWQRAHTDEDNLARVRETAEAGYRQFLFPPPLPGQTRAHVWSFLSPVATITLRTHKETGAIATSSLSGTTLTDTAGQFLSYAVEAGDTIQLQKDGESSYEEEQVDSVTSETVLELVSAPSTGNGEYDYYVDEPAWQYPAPDDYAGLVGDRATVENSGTYGPALLRGEGVIRALRARGTSSGAPKFFAVRPKALLTETGQRWEIIVWPNPSSALTVYYRYNVLVGKWGHVRTSGAAATIDTTAKTLTMTGETFKTDGCLVGDKVILSSPSTSDITTGIYVIATVDTDTQITLTTAPGSDGTADYEVLPANLYALGGMQHGRTLVASALAEAERSRDEEKGRQWDWFMERLAASVSADENMLPTTLGYNRDASDVLVGRPRRDRYVEYEGQVPGEFAP